MFQQLRTLVDQQLQALNDTTRLIIIHPNYVEQHIVLTHFLKHNAVYRRFNGKRLTRDQLRLQLEEALASQNISSLADCTLILDECDRAISAEFNLFLPEVVSEIGKGRVIIFSREMPRCVIEHAALRREASFIPDDENFMLWDYARRDDETSLLEVRAFGEGHVLLNGQSVDNWDGVLPRTLFFYLVDRGMATRNEIFETFWPNLPVREATNVFHVTKRKISEVLGIDLTTYWSGFYRISPEIRLSYDVVLFTEMVNNSAIAPTDQAVEGLTRAAALYQGPYLNATDTEWTKRRRGELALDYGEALASLAKAKEELGNKRHALGLYLRAAAVNRQREDLTSNIMRLYRDLDMPADALHVFERLSDELRVELGVSPAPHLQQMADVIRQGIS